MFDLYQNIIRDREYCIHLTQFFGSTESLKGDGAKECSIFSGTHVDCEHML